MDNIFMRVSNKNNSKKHLTLRKLTAGSEFKVIWSIYCNFIVVWFITVFNGKITFSVPQNAPFPVKIAFIEITPLQTQGDLEYQFSYDQYANLSDDSAFTYSWNSSGKLLSATRKNFAESPDDAPEKVTYSYDPLGRRVLVKYYGDENAPYKNQWRSFITVYNGFLPIEELYVNYQGSIAGVKAKYFYDNAGRLVKAELDTDFDGVLDQTCLTILDDRGTLIGVAKGRSPIDNTRFAGAHWNTVL